MESCRQAWCPLPVQEEDAVRIRASRNSVCRFGRLFTQIPPRSGAIPAKTGNPCRFSTSSHHAETVMSAVRFRAPVFARSLHKVLRGARRAWTTFTTSMRSAATRYSRTTIQPPLPRTVRPGEEQPGLQRLRHPGMLRELAGKAVLTASRILSARAFLIFIDRAHASPPVRRGARRAPRDARPSPHFPVFGAHGRQFGLDFLQVLQDKVIRGLAHGGKIDRGRSRVNRRFRGRESTPDGRSGGKAGGHFAVSPSPKGPARSCACQYFMSNGT